MRNQHLLKLFLIFLFGASSVAFGESPYTAEQALKDARQEGQTFDVFEYRKVLGKLEKLASVHETADQAFPFILILDELKLIGDQNGVAAGTLVQTGKILTREAVKFVNLVSDEFSFLSTFFKWSIDNDKASAIAKQSRALKNKLKRIETQFSAQGDSVVTEKKLEYLGLYHVRIPEIFQHFDGMAVAPKAFVYTSLEELQNRAVMYSIKLPLNNDQFAAVLNNLTNKFAFDEVHGLLQRQLNEKMDDATLSNLLPRLISFASAVERNAEHLPQYISNYPSELLLRHMEKVVNRKVVIDSKLAPVVIRSMEKSFVEDLVLVLYNAKLNGYHRVNSSFLFALVKEISALYNEHGLYANNRKLEELTQQFAILNLVGQFEIEGRYTINLGGRSARLSVVQTGSSDICIMISELFPWGEWNHMPMCNVYYNIETGRYRAWRHSISGLDASNCVGVNWNFEFKFEEAECRPGKPDQSQDQAGKPVQSGKPAQRRQYERRQSGKVPELPPALQGQTVERLQREPVRQDSEQEQGPTQQDSVQQDSAQQNPAQQNPAKQDPICNGYFSGQFETTVMRPVSTETKISAYPTYASLEAKKFEGFSGTYVGKANETGQKVILQVEKVNSLITAKMRLPDISERVYNSFPIPGIDVASDTYFFTAPAILNAEFDQVRGQFVGNKFVGHYILASKGIRLSFELTKQDSSGK